MVSSWRRARRIALLFCISDIHRSPTRADIVAKRPTLVIPGSKSGAYQNQAKVANHPPTKRVVVIQATIEARSRRANLNRSKRLLKAGSSGPSGPGIFAWRDGLFSRPGRDRSP